ncbi:MAG TPA: tyrosine-type recombinase/integrase [Paenalcaligenes hominis]|uniref:Tyrosine-type recombinase/integrase n=1 Tax=Paenalcaligenes hominis TaxID=643674 RepID=A0A9D2VGK3_9BURK|nr:tyrosine-type recombinase/integrase [Paenalcaligenes hominis]
MSLPIPAALEFYAPYSVEIDGSRGTNRAHTPSTLLHADNDVDALQAWLAQYIDSPNTFTSYRKESERLLLWANLERNKAISSLTHEDLLLYQQFLRDPAPRSRWVLKKGAKVARSHEDWRPFAGPLSASSIRQALTVLNSMYSWLVSAGYLAANPLAVLRGARTAPAKRMQRYLDMELWEQVKQCIEHLPQETQREKEHYYRYRWLFSLLYMCGLRVSELSQNRMNSLFSRRDRHGTLRWWMDIEGKGQKSRTIPITEELMDELIRYRTFKGLPPYPTANEDYPLVLPIGYKQSKPLTRAAIHNIVKRIFTDTAAYLRSLGDAYESDALHVEQASTHWLRHTAGTHMIEQDMDLLHVRDTLGHSSINTTNRYLHTADDARHDATQDKHKLKW